MNNVKLDIRERYHAMSRAEKRISDFVLTHSSDCLLMTAADIAKNSEVSPATIIRYVQKLGFDGLEGFKLALAGALSQEQQEHEQDWNMIDPIISKEDSLEAVCGKMENMVSGAIRDLFYQLDYEALNKAIEKVRRARQIYLLGIGASSLPAQDLFHQLKRAGFDAHFYFDTNMAVEFFHYIDKRDVVIAFSYSGQSKEILYACEIAARQKACVIAVTRKWDSPSGNW